MRKLCAKIIPKVLTDEQNKDVLTVAMTRKCPRVKFSQKGNESWIYEYDSETKRQSKE